MKKFQIGQVVEFKNNRMYAPIKGTVLKSYPELKMAKVETEYGVKYYSFSNLKLV